MPDDERIQQAACVLYEAHRARRPFGPLPEALAPRTVDEAYAVQEAFHRHLAEMRGPTAGYKIALTAPVMQQMVGFHQPFAGAIMANTIHRSPVALPRADYVRLGIECEIAVQLGRDLPAAQAPYRRDQVAEAVAAVMPAFELVDDRQADYTKLAALILTLIADNAWNAGIVLGAPLTSWHAVDLAAVHGVLRINDAVVGEGHGRDVMGHPLEALAWLANTLVQRGKTLTQGMIVMTGSMVATKFVNPGDVVNLTVEGLGDVQLSVA
ncbi:MAG TPA: fumarylacetoacetate hydrolase family protein [Alphaproteobacteria bacterium]|nr:fumarylacetoacetate hydrolase family protein [Alphaproteobacteria bacterium]